MDTQLKETPGYNPCPTCLHHQDKKSIDDVSDKCFPCVWEHSKSGFWPNYQQVSYSNSPAEDYMSQEELQGWQGYQEIKIVKKDNVNSPKHYTTGGIETIAFIKAKLGVEGTVAYCMGNVIKYVTRWKDKGGLEDLQKALWYLNYAIELMKEEDASE